MDSLADKISDAVKHLEKRDTMTNVDDLKKLYEEAKNMAPSKAMRLVQQAKSDEERRFYGFIAEMNLQRAQKKAIERNLF